MSTLHIISDLFLGYNESSPIDEVLPDVDLVIFNGNLGHIKRGMLYVETLCKKYPNVQFVYNPGQTERYLAIPKSMDEFDDSLNIRKQTNPGWPKNLHWSTDPQLIKLRNDRPVEVFCTYGFPKIHGLMSEWKDTAWSTYVVDVLDDPSPEGKFYKPKETSNVRHGIIPVYATIESINELHTKEWLRVKKWEIESPHKKILVTHVNPYQDLRTQNMQTSPYLIHLEHGLWVGSSTPNNGVQFLGSRLYSNPGRGSEIRSKVFQID